MLNDASEDVEQLAVQKIMNARRTKSSTVQIEGLTGEIKFNENGKRKNYTLHVMEMTMHSAMVKVAEWSDVSGLTVLAPKNEKPRPPTEIEKNRTYIVTTITVNSDHVP
ncbi:unnamed protein product [Bemisia tabaci]|uniref:Receptor ligand binding region domain-containing protein n=1 Tax=Bemisia tabaci TaxID=7038 RepID=A0A9P0AHZ8_BEMTA|nr:unnamed protein product [Bemisia tabaci]